MSRFNCEDCGQPINLNDYWWRHNYKSIEYYCPRCARSHMGGPGYGFGLMYGGSPEVAK